MASNGDIGDDSYIANLLKDEAKAASIRYSAQGLQALLPRRALNGAPKPNTRFLKTIIKETDSHNAALKRREEREAELRLRRIGDSRRGEYDGGREKKRRRPSDEHRQTGSSRREINEARSRRRHPDESSDRDESLARERYRDSRRRRNRDEKGLAEDSDKDPDPGKHSSHHHRHEKESKRRPAKRRTRSVSRSSSPERRREDGHRKKRRRGLADREKKLSTQGRSHSPTSRRERCKDGQKKPPPRVQNASHSPVGSPIDDSSSLSGPLDSIVGSLPPAAAAAAVNARSRAEGTPRGTNALPPPTSSRGRGAHKASSAIDAHFSANYDPTLDVRPPMSADSSLDDDENEDWDMALEALRDRAMFRTKQAERLRAVGFSEADIKKWKNSSNDDIDISMGEGGREKGVEAVQWRRKGEAREWDVGKVVVEEEDEDEDGHKMEDDPAISEAKASKKRAKAAKQRMKIAAAAAVDDAWTMKRRDGRSGGLLRGFKKALGS